MSDDDSDDDDSNDDAPPHEVQAELAPALSQVLSEADPTELHFLTRADVVAPVRLWGRQRRLKFANKDREAQFQTEHAVLARGILQVVLPLATLLFAIFHLWGVLLKSGHRRQVFLIRSSVLLVWILFILLSHTSWFLPRSQLFIYLISMCGYAGTNFILSLIRDGFVNGLPALGLAVTACTTCGAMLFSTALQFCTSALLITNALILLGPTSENYSLAFVLVNTNFILLSFCLFSLLTSYNLEMHLRHRFWYTGTVSYWTNPADTQAEEKEEEEEEEEEKQEELNEEETPV